MNNAEVVLYFAIVDDVQIIPSNDQDVINLVESSSHKTVVSPKYVNTPTKVPNPFDYSSAMSDYGSTWYAIAVVKITYKNTILFHDDAIWYGHWVYEYSDGFSMFP